MKLLDKIDKQVWDGISKYKKNLDKGKLTPYKELWEEAVEPFSISLFMCCLEHAIFQFFPKEFVETLAKDIKRLNPKRIVEVGAGDGNLSKALMQFGVDSKPTDNYSWSHCKDKPKVNNINYPKEVEKIDFKEALKKYNPDLVIICWEELGAEFTNKILEYPSVKWVIWIGEDPGGCCGNESSFKNEFEILKNPYCLARTDMSGIRHTSVFLFKKNRK